MVKRFEPKVIDALLDKLSHDDGFRDLFQSDPRSALAQVGHITPDELVGVSAKDPVLCVTTNSLASKEDIQSGREKLQSRMLIQDPFSYFQAK